MAERSSVLRRYLITGLLTWLPLAVTVWVLVKVLGLLDGVFQWLVVALKALIRSEERRVGKECRL